MQVPGHSSANGAVVLASEVVNGSGQPTADAAAANWLTVAWHVSPTEPNTGTPAAKPFAHAAP
eukprot:1253109-Prymnesium_polylepis.1